MSPEQINVSQSIIRPLGEEGTMILVHPRDKDLMLKAIKSIKDTEGLITLHAHIQRDTQKAHILDVFSAYLDRIALIVWDTRSRVGRRSHVRYWSFEKALELFTKSVRIIDSDLQTFHHYAEIAGVLKRHHLENGHDIIRLLQSLTAEARQRGKFLVSVKHNDNHLDRARERETASILSGVWCFVLDLIREYRETHPGWNPFSIPKRLNMKIGEDIIASWIMIHGMEDKKNRLLRYDHASWDGDRGSYFHIEQEEAEDYVKMVKICGLPFIRRALQKRMNNRNGSGECAVLAMEAHGTELKYNIHSTVSFESAARELLGAAPGIVYVAASKSSRLRTLIR